MRIEYFQLLDRVIDVNLAEQTLRAEAQVPASNTIFEGHFPGYPLMPGALLVEAMAQAGGWLIIAVCNFQRLPLLAAIKEAKLRTFVRPGESLAVSATLAHHGSGFAVVRGAITVENKHICDAEILYRVIKFPTPNTRQEMEKLARRLQFPMEALTNG
jgi:3-hydroxyacyl-[acyl-carrier-protein] dehydratase